MTEATKERINYYTELLKLLVTVDIAVAVGVVNLLFKADSGNKLASVLLFPGFLFLIVGILVSVVVFLRLKNLVDKQK